MQNPLVVAPNGAICCKLWPHTILGRGGSILKGGTPWLKSCGNPGGNPGKFLRKSYGKSCGNPGGNPARNPGVDPGMKNIEKNNRFSLILG